MSRTEEQAARRLLEKSLARYSPEIAFASSFGAEDVVLIDMIAGIDPSTRIFTLDTGRLPAEVDELIDRIRQRYGLSIRRYVPRERAVEEMVDRHGLDLFYRSHELRRLCCNVRKVEPLREALAGLRAWITGLRREQAVSRTSLRRVGIDRIHGSIVKINPLADWSSRQIWDYIGRHDVPYNALHDRGYPSIGCAPCTRAVAPGADIRSGRWWWEDPADKECGLHPHAETADARS